MGRCHLCSYSRCGQYRWKWLIYNRWRLESHRRHSWHWWICRRWRQESCRWHSWHWWICRRCRQGRYNWWSCSRWRRTICHQRWCKVNVSEDLPIEWPNSSAPKTWLHICCCCCQREGQPSNARNIINWLCQTLVALHPWVTEGVHSSF